MTEEKKPQNSLAKKISRIKEVFLLKLTLWSVKYSAISKKTGLNQLGSNPIVQKLGLTTPAKAAWKGLLLGSLIYLFLGISDIYSGYSDKAENSIEDGKRVIVELATGKVTARKKPESNSVDEATESEEDIAELDTPESEATNDEESLLSDFKDSIAAVSTQDIEDKRPRVVIIMTGLGLSNTTTDNVFTLPAEVALSFSPYAAGIDEWTSKAAELGYELLMDLPFEPIGYPESDPGPYGLLVEQEAEQINAQLKSVLDLTEERLIGLTAPVEEQFTYVEDKIVPLLKETKSKGLTLIYNNAPRNYFLPQTAERLELPLIANDKIVDEQLSKQGILNTLSEAELIAFDKGYVVLLARPYPITVEHLHDWLKKFSDKGLLLIPLSEIL